MISLEQVQLLETKVSKAIEYVQRVTAENAALRSQRQELQAKLEANKKRIDELEVLVMRFKEDQSRIEDGVMAALDRLSQFEEAFENSLKDKGSIKKPPVKTRDKPPEPQSKEVFFEIPKTQTAEGKPAQTAEGANANAAPSGDAPASEGELDIF
jgi:predicted nuclease with TOPRIM domain